MNFCNLKVYYRFLCFRNQDFQVGFKLGTVKKSAQITSDKEKAICFDELGLIIVK